MKAGANNTDQVKIREMAAQGDSAEDISYRLSIIESVVVSFMGGAKKDKPVKAKAKSKSKTETKNKLADCFNET